jgi:hypothetical protein
MFQIFEPDRFAALGLRSMGSSEQDLTGGCDNALDRTFPAWDNMRALFYGDRERKASKR